MIEVVGDLWDFHAAGEWITVAINGRVEKGKLVMGVGTARQARERLPGVDRLLGDILLRHPELSPIYLFPTRIVFFPTKHDWLDPRADLRLISEGCRDVVENWDNPREQEANARTPDSKLYMPRLGCGAGKLPWSRVRPIIAALDDRFIVVSRKEAL